MKKLLIVLFSFGIVAAASAQRYDHDGYDRGTVTVGVSGGRYAIDRRIDEINREFDHRIWEVRTDPRLSGHEKRRMIRRLNHEREDRIRDVRRHGRVGVGVRF